MPQPTRFPTVIAGCLVASLALIPACNRTQRSEQASPSTDHGQSSTRAPADPGPPKLERPLAVPQLPAQPGEPTSLIGGKSILCAQRHNAPIACVGRIGLRLRPPKEADWPLYPDGQKAETPLGLVGRDLSRLDAHSRARCIIEDGLPFCWRGASHSRDIKPVPLTVNDALEVRALTRGQQAVRTKNGDYVQLQVQPCKGRQNYGAKPRTPADLGKVRRIMGGQALECVITTDNTVACWGEVTGPQNCTEAAVTIEGLTNIVDGAGGMYSACVLRSDNRVLCFGDNRGYALGVPPEELDHSDAPFEVPGVFPAVKLDGIDNDFVALGANGEVWAWGPGHVDEDVGGRARRFDMPRPAVDVAVFDGMFCALLDDHSLRCEGQIVDIGLAAGTGRPAFESKDAWVNAVTHQIVELIDDPSGGVERDEAREKQGLPPFSWD